MEMNEGSMEWQNQPSESQNHRKQYLQKHKLYQSTASCESCVLLPCHLRRSICDVCILPSVPSMSLYHLTV